MLTMYCLNNMHWHQTAEDVLIITHNVLIPSLMKDWNDPYGIAGDDAQRIIPPVHTAGPSYRQMLRRRLGVGVSTAEEEH